MKKFFVLFAVLILAAGLCFAQEQEAPELPKPEKFDLEISAGFPVHWTNAEHDETFYYFHNRKNDYLDPTQLDKTVTANTAFGAALLWNFGRKVGLTIDYDFFYAARVAGFSNPTSDYNSMFGQNLLIGPVFFLYNSPFLRIPLAIGAHMYYFSDELWIPYLDPNTPAPVGYWIKRKEFQFGPGIYLGVQFHFNNSIYIFSRTNVSIDIFRWHQIKWIVDDLETTPPPPGTTPPPVTGANYTNETNTHTELSVSWGVKPTLGIGIKF